MLKFEYGSDGSVFRVLDQFSRLREPTVAIPIEITKLTGITPEMVAGNPKRSTVKNDASEIAQKIKSEGPNSRTQPLDRSVQRSR
jgi:DNA polymerase III epsilon subunit-like protein